MNEPQLEKPALVEQAPQVAGGEAGNGTSPTHPVARRLRELLEAAGKDQALEQETLMDAPQNGAPQSGTPQPDDGGATEPGDDSASESSSGIAVEEAADVSELGLIAPPSTTEPGKVELAEVAPSTDWWAESTLLTGEPTDTVMTSPTQPHAIRLDLEPAFARVSSTDDEPEDWVMVALEGVLAEVRQGTMSPAQVSAITDLVQAVTDLVAARRSARH